MLETPVDLSSRAADFEKRRKEELKKVTKIVKKEQNEVEELANGKGPEERARLLKERIKRSILDAIKV